MSTPPDIYDVMFIPLTQGKFATIDRADFPIVAGRKWHASKGRSTFYAASKPRGKCVTYMHRLIMGNSAIGLLVDHRDHNGLNQRRRNLRTCTQAQNYANSTETKFVKNATSRYRGVCFHKQTRRWQSTIHVNRKLLILGRFDAEEQAARAYDHAASIHFGEFAKLNFGVANEQQQCA